MKQITNRHPLSLVNIGKGELNNRFLQEMKKTLENIKDENTSLKKREIIVKFTITPHKDRGSADVAVAVDAKLEPIAPYQSSIYIGQDLYGETQAHETIRVPDETYPGAFDFEISTSAGTDTEDGAGDDTKQATDGEDSAENPTEENPIEEDELAEI